MKTRPSSRWHDIEDIAFLEDPERTPEPADKPASEDLPSDRCVDADSRRLQEACPGAIVLHHWRNVEVALVDHLGEGHHEARLHGGGRVDLHVLWVSFRHRHRRGRSRAAEVAEHPRRAGGRSCGGPSANPADVAAGTRCPTMNWRRCSNLPSVDWEPWSRLAAYEAAGEPEPRWDRRIRRLLCPASL